MPYILSTFTKRIYRPHETRLCLQVNEYIRTFRTPVSGTALGGAAKPFIGQANRRSRVCATPEKGAAVPFPGANLAVAVAIKAVTDFHR
jgi:hypothetical protein